MPRWIRPQKGSSTKAAARSMPPTARACGKRQEAWPEVHGVVVVLVSRSSCTVPNRDDWWFAADTTTTATLVVVVVVVGRSIAVVKR